MSRTVFLTLLLLLAAGSFGGPAALAESAGEGSSEAQEPESFLDALRQGRGAVDLRYRLETVDQDGIDDDAFASTLRTTVSYRSAAYRGLELFLEAENVTAVFDDDTYRNAGAGSLSNRVTDRPVVADPEITEIDQAYLRWTRGRVKATVGRQGINLGDQRFLGTVGWRQNHQSFDALRLEVEAGPRVRVEYSYIDRVHRIFGDSQAMASHFLTVPISLPGESGKLTPYAYRLDYDDEGPVALSTLTVGLEYAGARLLAAERKLLWEAEYARQTDTGDNPRQVEADYWHAMVGVATGPVTVKLAWEVLGGAPGDGRFTTPLATLHKFNGWADKFLVTPPDGLEALSLTLSGALGPARWTVTYLDFSADAGGADYGSEVDALLTYKAPWGQGFGLKLALYDADTFATDTFKAMLWSSYRF